MLVQGKRRGWCEICESTAKPIPVIIGYLYKSFYFREVGVDYLDLIIDGVCERGTIFECFIDQQRLLETTSKREMCMLIDDAIGNAETMAIEAKETT